MKESESERNNRKWKMTICEIMMAKCVSAIIMSVCLMKINEKWSIMCIEISIERNDEEERRK